MGKTLFSLKFVRDLYRVSNDQGSIRTSTRSTPGFILRRPYPQRSPAPGRFCCDTDTTMETFRAASKGRHHRALQVDRLTPLVGELRQADRAI